MTRPALTLREVLLARLKSFEPEYQQLLRQERSAPHEAPPQTVPAVLPPSHC